MNKWQKLADKATIEKTFKALKENGIGAEVVENGQKAKKRVLDLIPENAEVMTMTSITLETIGLDKEINESGKFKSVRNQLMTMNRENQAGEMRKLGTAPDWVVGSVHGVTEAGQVMVASASGSQLPAYAYGAGNVIWVVGTQKIVKNIQEGFKRIYEYSFPLEDERAQKAYGIRSGVNKILIINKEFTPGRIKMILVKEKLGF